MGFRSFLRNLFIGESAKEEEALDAARLRHGITVDKKEANIRFPSEQQRIAEEYDAWEELKNFRSNFFLGGWMNKRFHRPFGENKLKADLERIAEKRRLDDQRLMEKERLEAEEKQKKGEG
jgi:hypothetical protein